MILCKDVHALLHVISLVDWPKHVKFVFRGYNAFVSHGDLAINHADLAINTVTQHARKSTRFQHRCIYRAHLLRLLTFIAYSQHHRLCGGPAEFALEKILDNMSADTRKTRWRALSLAVMLFMIFLAGWSSHLIACSASCNMFAAANCLASRLC